MLHTLGVQPVGGFAAAGQADRLAASQRITCRN
jgi:hypothetical protein